MGTGVQAQAGDTAVLLTWPIVPGASRYIVFRTTVEGGEGTAVGTTARTCYTDTGLNNGTTYYYTVAGTTAQPGDGIPDLVGPRSDPVSAMPLAGLIVLSALAEDGEVSLSWTPLPCPYQYYETTYKVYRDNVLLATTAATNAADTAVTDGQAHSYYVTPIAPVELPNGNMTTVEGTASNTVTITPNPADKVWDPGLPIGEDLQNFNPVANGRMVMPQDQRGTTASPARVVVPQGHTVACEVEAATDLDHWTEGVATGYESSAAGYAWTATGGTFDATSSRSANWTAPNTPGKYTLTCTMSDGQTGARHDPDLVRNVSVIVTGMTIQVRRMESGSAYASSATIAAGGCDSPEQKADVLVTVTPGVAGIAVAKPTIVGGAGVLDKSHDAHIEDWTGVTDAEGKARGVYWGSNQLGPGDPNSDPSCDVTVGDPLGSHATIHQKGLAPSDANRWSGCSQWGAGTSARITFRARFSDGQALIPIHGHAFLFGVRSVTVEVKGQDGTSTLLGYALDPKYVPAGTVPQHVATLDTFAVFSPACVQEGSDGLYASSLAVKVPATGSIEDVGYYAADQTTNIPP